MGGSDSGGGWRPGLTARQRQELEADCGGERWRRIGGRKLRLLELVVFLFGNAAWCWCIDCTYMVVGGERVRAIGEGKKKKKKKMPTVARFPVLTSGCILLGWITGPG